MGSILVAIVATLVMVLEVDYTAIFDPNYLDCDFSNFSNPDKHKAFNVAFLLIMCIFPIIISTVVNIIILMIIWMSGRSAKSSGNLRSSVAILLICWCFIISYIPFIVQELVRSLNGSLSLEFSVFTVYAWSFNSTLNPIIVFCSNKSFKRFVLGIFCPCRLQATPAATPYKGEYDVQLQAVTQAIENEDTTVQQIDD